MKQVFATANGKIILKEMPPATLRGIGAIVENVYSAISVGTEGMVLQRMGENPAAAGKELPLGYSSVGRVTKISEELADVRVGDHATCAGGGVANHAQECYLPQNLLTYCPPGIDPREAAFTTLGAIALQGLRRGRIECGDTVAVIGLGMVGQLAFQMAKAAGARVIALDMQETRLKLAERLGADLVVNARDKNAKETISEFTGKRGVDLAVVTAGSPTSAAPLVQALEIVRHRGRICVVGAVKCDFSRDLWFSKDAELTISQAYGPGRYDPQYEEEGRDYPYAYVRWTEGRNLEEVVRLLGTGQLKIAPLISHEFAFENAQEAYELIRTNPLDCLGVLLKY